MLARLVCLLRLTLAAPIAHAAIGHAPIEQGVFRLHKIAQPIGEERYTISADSGGGQRIASEFAFVDRGTRVPLIATLRTRDDGSPWSFELAGNVSRESKIDVAVTVRDAHAEIVADGVHHTRALTTGQPRFTIDGYAPVVIQQELVRYWLAHGEPGTLLTLPAGNVRIARRGVDTLLTDAGSRTLTRYSVRGVVWGRETLWLDDSLRAVALITQDAELDHFEAVRDGYESLLGRFIALGATDALAGLTDLTAATARGAAAEGDSAADGDPFAIVGADLIDGTGEPLVRDAVVVVREGKIVAAGPRARTPVPSDVAVIDGRGKTVMPGLWDMHAHYEQVEWGAIYLASGVTTVRDVGNELEFIRAVRDAVRAGRGLGPRILTAGVIDGSGPAALGVIRADTPAEGRTRVQRYHEAGFDQIKIYSSVRPEVLAAICDEAHKLGMSVTGHIPNGLTAYDGVNAGMDQINHISYVAAVAGPIASPSSQQGSAPSAPSTLPVPSVDSSDPATKRLVAFLLDHHTVLDPTLALFEWIEHPASQPVADFEPGVTKVAPELAEPLTHAGASPQMAARAASVFARYLATVRIMHRAGVPIVAGTDQTVPGYSLHREMELYVQAGFTPMEAIQAATIVPARVMHVDNEVGTLMPGKRADLLLIDGHPLERIADTRNVVLVVSNGRRYLPAPLWRSVEFTP
jgi:imidazolonepropionase-like amidohydrolase